MPGTLISFNLMETLQGMYNYSCLTVEKNEAQRLNNSPKNTEWQSQDLSPN